MGRFLEGLRTLVMDETATQKQNIHQTWSKPVASRVSDGRAIEGVRVADIRPNGYILLTCEQNSSRFREGDILRLNRGNPFESPAFMVTLESDDETRMIVSSQDLGINWGPLNREADGWILDEGYIDLTSWVLDALDEAGDTHVGRDRILPLIMGYAQPMTDSRRFVRGMNMGERWKLNFSQTEALAQAYGTDLTYLIQGPPGTGKTRLLAHLAQLLVEDGERVLVTSFTHRAINNALNTLKAVAPQIPVAKIGQESRTDDLETDNYEEFVLCPMAHMSQGYVIGGTPFATRTRRLSGVEFETVIFDEASQITLPLAVMGMLAAKKYIFIGDQKQLPPVLTTRLSGGAFRESIFGSLVERGYDTMLEVTFRLSKELAEWPSRQFYEQRLIPTPKISDWRVEYPRPPARLMHILDPDEPKVFWDLAHRNTTTRSYKEANAVEDLISTLLKCGFPPEEVAVVVPYRAQAREIRNRLRRLTGSSDLLQQIVVDTVERMQGQERDLVILSLTTSNPGFASGLADFFFLPQRLNVAITRPRKKLIVIGSRHVLNAVPDSDELLETVNMLRDFLGSCVIYRSGS